MEHSWCEEVLEGRQPVVSDASSKTFGTKVLVHNHTGPNESATQLSQILVSGIRIHGVTARRLFQKLEAHFINGNAKYSYRGRCH